MPRFTSYGNSGAIATSGLSITENLPTSPGKNWQQSAHSVTDYNRRLGEAQSGTRSATISGGLRGLTAAFEASETRAAQSDFPGTNTPGGVTGTSRIVGLQKWAGQVYSVDNGLITVELVPLDHDGPTLFADFDLRLIAPDERKAKPGAIVYLTTRMIQGNSGHVEAVTNLRLRHPRRWSRAELSEVKRRGRDRAKSFARYARRGGAGT
jgi:hypothetical protein